RDGHVTGVQTCALPILPRGARVADALARAGGATRKAQLELVNLAAPIADGEQVVFPRRGSASVTGSADPGAAAGPVHLSTATLRSEERRGGEGGRARWG